MNQNWKPHQISSYKMCLYANHKMSFQFSLWVEETSKMQACKTFSSMHGRAWHFMYKKTIRKGSNMYKNHLRRQRSVWVTLNPNPAAANPCPRPPFTTLLLALLFLETMLPRKSRWLGIVYIQVLYSNEHCTYSSWVWIYNLKGSWMFFVCLFDLGFRKIFSATSSKKTPKTGSCASLRTFLFRDDFSFAFAALKILFTYKLYNAMNSAYVSSVWIKSLDLKGLKLSKKLINIL